MGKRQHGNEQIIALQKKKLIYFARSVQTQIVTMNQKKQSDLYPFVLLKLNC